MNESKTDLMPNVEMCLINNVFIVL